jgi:hypothetical protein
MSWTQVSRTVQVAPAGVWSLANFYVGETVNRSTTATFVHGYLLHWGDGSPTLLVPGSGGSFIANGYNSFTGSYIDHIYTSAGTFLASAIGREGEGIPIGPTVSMPITVAPRASRNHFHYPQRPESSRGRHPGQGE